MDAGSLSAGPLSGKVGPVRDAGSLTAGRIMPR